MPTQSRSNPAPVAAPSVAPRFPRDARLTPREAATYLGKSTSTLEAWRRQGVGPRFYRIGPGTRAGIFYVVNDIDAWISASASRASLAEVAA
ncbi:helix-turn-helix transcriptional regulator [Roseomonas rosulenta]|uniref:helix-turn-helix transcriptional regulator n=1 Tax=Roseomonas rosulenta TaxID=2748667 RepID=UPI0018DF958E|nr:helix-turn-helix domain-containing protein [Roseomonas rosulenta]